MKAGLVWVPDNWSVIREISQPRERMARSPPLAPRLPVFTPVVSMEVLH
jgi:mRNA-degrading endonuclease toxin of MazEF toxin-antitoxin module